MAIMGVAAIASMGSVAAGVVAVQTIATIALVVTAVGYATDSPVLKKIGAGMGLGAAGAGMMGLGAAEGGVAAASSTESGIQASAEGVSNAGMTTAEVAQAPAGLNTDVSGLLESSSSVAPPPISPSIDASLVGAPDTGGIISNANEAIGRSLDVQVPTSVADTVSGANAPVDISSPSSPFERTLGQATNTPKPNIYDTKIESKGFFEGLFDDKNQLMQLGGQALSGMQKSKENDQLYELQKDKLKLMQDESANSKQLQANRNNVPLATSMYNKNFKLTANGLPSTLIGNK